LSWNAAQLYSTGVLSVSPFSAADFDEDSDVDGADLAAWRVGFGAQTGVTHRSGDADADADVDGRDFLAWQRQLGRAAAASANSVVPEPASLGLAATCLLAGKRRSACR
jgi:hypothetical protein